MKTLEDKLEYVVHMLYAVACPQPEKGKRFIPIIQGLCIISNTNMDKWIENNFEKMGMDISDALYLDKENTKFPTNQLAIHTKYLKLNIALAYINRKIDWKTIDYDESMSLGEIEGFGDIIGIKND